MSRPLKAKSDKTRVNTNFVLPNIQEDYPLFPQDNSYLSQSNIDPNQQLINNYWSSKHHNEQVGNLLTQTGQGLVQGAEDIMLSLLDPAIALGELGNLSKLYKGARAFPKLEKLAPIEADLSVLDKYINDIKLGKADSQAYKYYRKVNDPRNIERLKALDKNYNTDVNIKSLDRWNKKFEDVIYDPGKGGFLNMSIEDLPKGIAGQSNASIESTFPYLKPGEQYRDPTVDEIFNKIPVKKSREVKISPHSDVNDYRRIVTHEGKHDRTWGDLLLHDDYKKDIQSIFRTEDEVRKYLIEQNVSIDEATKIMDLYDNFVKGTEFDAYIGTNLKDALVEKDYVKSVYDKVSKKVLDDATNTIGELKRYKPFVKDWDKFRTMLNKSAYVAPTGIAINNMKKNQKDNQEEYSLGGILKDTAIGAGTGALAGAGVLSVPGAIVGGAVGLTKGLFTHFKEKKEEQAQQDWLNSQEYAQQQAQQQADQQMAFQSNLGNYDNRTFAPTFPFGGQVGTRDVELEKQEVFETPGGQVGQVDGPSHKQGGVDVSLPVGTRIWSDKLKASSGLTYAQEAEKIKKQIDKYNKILNK